MIRIDAEGKRRGQINEQKKKTHRRVEGRGKKWTIYWYIADGYPRLSPISYLISETVELFRTFVKGGSDEMALNRVNSVFVFHLSLGLIRRSSFLFQRLREGLAS